MPKIRKTPGSFGEMWRFIKWVISVTVFYCLILYAAVMFAARFAGDD